MCVCVCLGAVVICVGTSYIERIITGRLLPHHPPPHHPPSITPSPVVVVVVALGRSHHRTSTSLCLALFNVVSAPRHIIRQDNKAKGRERDIMCDMLLRISEAI